MKDQLLSFRTRIHILLNDSGQDLIEYALVVKGGVKLDQWSGGKVDQSPVVEALV